jgi:hypothetical protein
MSLMMEARPVAPPSAPPHDEDRFVGGDEGAVSPKDHRLELRRRARFEHRPDQPAPRFPLIRRDEIVKTPAEQLLTGTAREPGAGRVDVQNPSLQRAVRDGVLRGLVDAPTAFLGLP